MLQLKPQKTLLLRPAFWLVFICYSRRNYLRNPEYRTHIFRIIKELGEKRKFKINALTFSPKKLQMIITPFNPDDLEKIIYQFQKKSGRYMREFLELPTPLWAGKPMIKIIGTAEGLAERKKYLRSSESLDLP